MIFFLRGGVGLVGKWVGGWAEVQCWLSLLGGHSDEEEEDDA